MLPGETFHERLRNRSFAKGDHLVVRIGADAVYCQCEANGDTRSSSLENIRRIDENVLEANGEGADLVVADHVPRERAVAALSLSQH